ncbi:MAG: hypothetical protein ACE5G3_10290, partial [Gammaproteobacteria bacterium]
MLRKVMNIGSPALGVGSVRGLFRLYEATRESDPLAFPIGVRRGLAYTAGMLDFDASRYPLALPHDPIREIGPDLYFAPGTIDVAPLMRVSRNMVIVRDGDTLTLVNPIRLSPQGEADLEALGTVRHAVRLGYFHGVDDAYTVAMDELDGRYKL